MVEKISINELKYFPEVLYIAERGGLIKNRALDIRELEEYNGSKIGGKTFDFKELYFILMNRNYEAQKVLPKIINSKNYGTYNFDKFVIDNYKIVNGVIDENKPAKFFYDLLDLLKDLNVKKWYFICKNKPPVNVYFTDIKIKKFGMDDYFIIKYYDPDGIHNIPRKIFCCVNCESLFMITDQERQYFKSRGLKIPKKCHICRKAKNNERINNKK